MSRLDEVISKYARMQDQSEEDERQRRARLPQASSFHAEDPPNASLESGEVWRVKPFSSIWSFSAGSGGSRVMMG